MLVASLFVLTTVVPLDVKIDGLGRVRYAHIENASLEMSFNALPRPCAAYSPHVAIRHLIIRLTRAVLVSAESRGENSSSLVRVLVSVVPKVLHRYTSPL